MKKTIICKLCIIISIMIILVNICTVYALDNVEIINIPNLNTKNYCVLDADNGRILAGNNINEKVYPASTTKILTAMLAYDYLDEKLPITVTSDVNNIPEGSSISPYKVGESYSRADIVRGLMIPSGNDMGILIAVTVARRVNNDKNLSYSDCIKYFSSLMNEKAKKLGANNSNFINPHGFHEEGHYTTPYDIAIIASHIKEYPELKDIVSEKKVEIKSTAGTGLVSSDNILYSHNEFLVSPTYGYKYATGIKTGYTEQAGYCLVGSALKDEKNIVLTLFNEKNADTRAIDAVTVCEYIFDNYKNFYKIEKGSTEDSIHLVEASKFSNSNLKIKYDSGTKAMMREGETVEKVYNFDEGIINKINGRYVIRRNIIKDEELGYADILINGEKIGRIKIFSANEIKKETKLDYFIYKVFIEKFGLLLLIIGIVGIIISYVLYRMIRNIKAGKH